LWYGHCWSCNCIEGTSTLGITSETAEAAIISLKRKAHLLISDGDKQVGFCYEQQKQRGEEILSLVNILERELLDERTHDKTKADGRKRGSV